MLGVKFLTKIRWDTICNKKEEKESFRNTLKHVSVNSEADAFRVID